MNHAIRTCNRTGLDYFVIGSNQQQGSDFAERLSHAFQYVFDKGYDHVIAIGSDCSSLHASHLREASLQVTLYGSALGPSKDGGVYLIGLSKHHFEQINFKDIDWKTDQVYRQLRSLLSPSLDRAPLPVLSDIDSAKDLADAIHRFANQSLFKFIRGILSAIKYTFFYYKPTPFAIPLFSFGLKAPPLTDSVWQRLC